MILALLLAAATPVAAPQAAAPTQQNVRIDISPAGQAIAKKYLGTPDPPMQAMAQRLSAVAQKMRGLASGKKLDVAQLATLVREQESIQSSMRRRGNTRMLAMLNEMNEADRIGFVRSIASAQPAKPASR